MKTEAGPVIAIIGGGFSGMMTAAQLVEAAQHPFTILLFEPSADIGLGLAYATTDPAHLLNVRADRMGAWAGQPGDFLAWLQNGRYSEYGAADFVPRRIFGEYLRSIWDQACRQAEEKNIVLRHVRDEVVSIDPGSASSIRTSNARYDAHGILLATGNPTTAAMRYAIPPERCLPSAWDAEALSRAVRDLEPKEHILILGSGLTMVDTVLTLKASGFAGSITALSRHGHLPLPHASTAAPYSGTIGEQLRAAPLKLAVWLDLLRQEIRQADGNWRGVIDALRPHTVALWRRLDARQKQRFYRHLLSLWNIHRHRMAPQIHQQIDQWQADGSLRLLAGRLGSLIDRDERLEAQLLPRGQAPISAGFDRFILCAGPGYDIRRLDDRLTKQLLRDNYVSPHASGFGMTVEEGYQLRPGLYAIGTPLIGDRLETTAVPELREEAAEVARLLLRSLSVALPR